MAYTDDWESLMNGVFGAGGKLKFGGAQPQPEKPQPKKPAGSSLPDLNAALLEQQKKLDELLKAQSAQLKTQDASAEAALADRLLEYTNTIKIVEGQMLDNMDLEKERGITIKSHEIGRAHV